MRRPVPVAAATLAAGLAAGPDGFARMAVTERDWICLAMGCASGLQDLMALWIDAGSVHMALGVPAQHWRVVVSLPLKRTGFPSVA